MRLAAEWMTGADDRILEFLNEEGPTAPKAMADDWRIRFSRTYVNTRCKKLAVYGLVQNLGNGVYSITEQGEAYLAGDMDADDLEPAHEDDR
ncbi:winged helix-turn-helix domain-containing protein [Halobacteriales archaeon QS_1_68_20]|nr:MAG: winged helix-turn-helix domain-containing protein [Halobacteriales archaeon QS_1_68_20]